MQFEYNIYINKRQGIGLERDAMARSEKTSIMVMSALFMAITCVCTMFIKIPTAAGYVHLGTMVVFLGVYVLGLKYGVLAGAVGTALADLLSGYAIWAPGSLAVVLLATLVYAALINRSYKKNEGIGRVPDAGEIAGIIFAALIFVLGYFMYGGSLVYDSWPAALLVVIPNLIQVLVGIFLARIIGMALCKMGTGRFFKYRFIK